jgi:hypothetical protein
MDLGLKIWQQKLKKERERESGNAVVELKEC